MQRGKVKLTAALLKIIHIKETVGTEVDPRCKDL
jgi:hypothetical protein